MKRLLTACLWIFFVSNVFAWQEVTLTKTETLGSIAEQYRPKGVSRMDMVIAIRNANPHVFSSQDEFKSGVALQIPTTEKEVRQAITGKLQVTIPVATKSVSPVNAISKKPIVPQKIANTAKVGSTVAKSSTAVPKKAVAHVSVVKGQSSTSVKSTALSLATPSKRIQQSKAEQQNKQATPQHKIVATPLLKKDNTANNELSAKLASANMMVKALQQSVNNQKQTINSYQEQLNQLTGQLNTAAQQNQNLSRQLSDKVNSVSSAKNLSNLWLVLWLFTLLLLLYQHYKTKKTLRADIEATAPTDPNFSSTFEPTLNMSLGREDIALKSHENASEASKTKENWEQVELDIPIVSAGEEEPQLPAHELEFYEDKTLAGEQQNIINAIAGDLGNVDWHRALLEFYIKTDNQNGFNRHYQNMLTGALMQEGDKLWEEVRKMYLNKWVYTPALYTHSI